MNKKLTATEILDIIQKHYGVDAFAYGYWTELENEIEGFEFSPQLLEDERKQNEAYEALSFHPDRHKYPQTEECEKLYNVWSDMYQKHNINSRKKQEILNHLGLGRVEEIDQYGGEGQGSKWYSVKHFVDHDVYIKTKGYYQSYSGTEFYDGYGHEVKPQTKTITVFE